jgi:hypothetical protein
MTTSKEDVIETEGITPETIKRVDDIYAKVPADLTDEDIFIMVDYLRQIAVNVEAAEKAGKRITKKAATNPTTPSQTVDSFLSKIVKES